MFLKTHQTGISAITRMHWSVYSPHLSQVISVLQQIRALPLDAYDETAEATAEKFQALMLEIVSRL